MCVQTPTYGASLTGKARSLDPNSTSPRSHHSARPSHPGVGGRPARGAGGHCVQGEMCAAGDVTKDRAVLEAPLT